MADEITLHGITWGHSRGYTPLMAYAQRFLEKYPGVNIIWKKRTLQEFADYPIEKLTDYYDMLIIDHPWVGCAADVRCVVPLDEYLPKAFMQDQLDNSVGYSHLSYNYGGHQWALAIDAATPVASYREDLFRENEALLPETWQDVLDLARKGKVAAPAIPIDLLMNFYMFCIAHGNEPFQGNEEMIDKETGLKALETMREFYSQLDEKMFSFNPIKTGEIMTQTDDYWYCPFSYGYSNYSRKGFGNAVLTFDGLVDFTEGNRLQSTLGGTGLAISEACKHKDWAVQFMKEIMSGECQSSFYVEHGGQPGHMQAWQSDHANRLTNNYFRNTLPTYEEAYVRPRYHGYLHFQDHAGDPIRNYFMEGGSPEKVLEDVNKIYRESFNKKSV